MILEMAEYSRKVASPKSHLTYDLNSVTLCLMKLRLDLVKQLRPQDLVGSVERNNHRYKPEPLFSKTGTGSLSSASTEERVNEVEHNTALIQKLMKRAASDGSKPTAMS